MIKRYFSVIFTLNKVFKEIINHGKIVAQGTKEEFMKDGKSVEETYLEITREAKEEK